MAERLWTMKILSGVHVGAEAALSEEEAVIGSDETCDFVLEDDGLAARHFSLEAGEAGVRLTLLDTGNPVYVDGRQVQGSIELEAYRVVSTGGLALAVGPAANSWPKIELPALPKSQSESEDGAAENGGASTGDVLVGAETPDQGEVAAAQTAADEPDRKRRRTQVWVMASVAMVVVVGFVWLLTPKQVARTQESAADAARQINEIASRYGAVIDVRRNDGTAPIFVTGNTQTEQNRLLFLDELAKTSIRATVHIVSSEELVEFAGAILDQSLNTDERNKVDVEPVARAPGELIVTGYVEEEASLAKTKAVLERDLKESRGLTYRVETKADRLAVLEQKLAALGLGSRFRIQQLGDGVGLFGPVRSKQELTGIVGLAKDFNAEFDSRPRLTLEGTDSFLGVSTIDLDIRAVVLGESIHVITHGGETHAEGSKIDDDYVIDTITEHYMILEKTGEFAGAGDADGPDFAYFIFEDD
ncbi:MAG: type III secretion system inner membrane ring subunit SctD [Rhodospirillaceae bacterium]|nr:type III secretion system inner membrane ring subunit SctD [Rhodospirillaceae bacterium]